MVWILGGVESDGESGVPKSWTMTVPERSRKCLVPCLKYKIHENSIVHSDGWSSYFTLGQHFKHWDFVNPSFQFKKPATGVQTNNVEGLWMWLKAAISRGARRKATEEYCQFWNFCQHVRNIPAYEPIGLFGMVGRITQLVILKDMGRQKDRVPNMSMTIRIVTKYPLPQPPSSASTADTKPCKRGHKPKAKRGRNDDRIGVIKK